MWPQAIVSDPGSRAGALRFYCKEESAGSFPAARDPDSVSLDGTPNVHFEKMFQFEMEGHDLWRHIFEKQQQRNEKLFSLRWANGLLAMVASEGKNLRPYYFVTNLKCRYCVSSNKGKSMFFDIGWSLPCKVGATSSFKRIKILWIKTQYFLLITVKNNLWYASVLLLSSTCFLRGYALPLRILERIDILSILQGWVICCCCTACHALVQSPELFRSEKRSGRMSDCGFRSPRCASGTDA